MPVVRFKLVGLKAGFDKRLATRFSCGMLNAISVTRITQVEVNILFDLAQVTEVPQCERGTNIYHQVLP